MPAGSKESLVAAVINGADAVYLGLTFFNARAKANNFKPEELKSIVKYAHKHNVKVYVTFNTLIKNSEIDNFLRYVGYAYHAGADSIILQDLGLAGLIKSNYPNLKIHVSTQANITNSLSIEPFKKFVDRIILARELSLDQIAFISSKYETEVFVQGALCISFSGQCLFSSFIGRRSGNRGFCAQPCRKMYNNKYLLSSKDLSLIDALPGLIRAKVRSFKVEGRMRSPGYVEIVTKVYRKYIDLYYKDPKSYKVEAKDIEMLKIAFNREFTKGFGFEKSIVDSRAPHHRGLFLGKYSEGIILKSGLKVGDGVGVWLKHSKLNKKDYGFKINKILKKGKEVYSAEASDFVVLPQLKQNALLFKTSSVDLRHDKNDNFTPSKEVLPSLNITIEWPSKKLPKQNKFFVKVYNAKEALKADGLADVIYYDLFSEDFREVKKNLVKSELFAYSPRIIYDEDYEKIFERINKLSPEGLLVSQPGMLSFAKKLGIKNIHLDYSFNIFNDFDLDSYGKLAIISVELSLEDLKGFANKNFIYFAHGFIRLMTTKEPIRAPELIDEKGKSFRVLKEHNHYFILNSREVAIWDGIKELNEIGVKYFFFDLLKNSNKILKLYRSILQGKILNPKIKKGYTRGHFKRGVY